MPNEYSPRKLQRVVSHGFDRVENFRKARYLFMNEYVGAFYDKADPGQASPVNLIFKAVSILVPHLVAKNPEHDVQAKYALYADYAEMLGLSLDQLAKDIKLKQTYRLAIIDAIFGMGIIKTGLAVSNQTLATEDGLGTNLTQPYADRVDLDDFTFDPDCRDFREATFLGNRVRVPRWWMLDSGLFDPAVVEKLPSVGDVQRRGKEALSLSRGRKRTGAGESTKHDSLVDYVDLVEVYLPDEQIIVTVPFGEHNPGDDYLRVVEYEGPDSGPYHFLGFHWAPNNPFPVAPCGIWYDLHQMANDHAAKANRQANRAKEVLVYGRQAADDAQEIVDADDGDSVAVDNPDQVKSVQFGGAMDDVYRHLSWIDMKFAESGPGDFNQLGGEHSEAGTATEASLLAAAATIRVGDMKDIIYDFTSEVGTDLAWWIHTDPLIEQPLVKRMPGGESMTLILTPEARHGEFLDYHIQVKWESMDRDNPIMRSQKLTQFVQTVVPTAIQTFVQLHAVGLGHMFNFVKFISINAKLQGIDNFEAVWNDPEFQAMLVEQMMRMPQMQGSVGMPVPGGEGMGQPQLGSSPVPPNQGAGLDPEADEQAALEQMGSAPMQMGNGNRSGRPGGGFTGVT